MADLTDSDFIAMPFIGDINAFRASRNPQIAPLKKNPALSKGDLICPSSGDELYAHNFLNAYDWHLVNKIMTGTSTNSSTAEEIEPPYKDDGFFCYLSSAQIKKDFGPDIQGQGSEPYNKRIVYTSSITESERIDLDYRRHLIEYEPASITFPNTDGKAPTASDFSSAFTIAESNRQSLSYCSAVFPYSRTFVPDATAWQYSGTPNGRERGGTQYTEYKRDSGDVVTDFTAIPTQFSNSTFKMCDLVVAKSLVSESKTDTYDILDFNNALASIGVYVSAYWENSGGNDSSSRQVTKVTNLGGIGSVTKNENNIFFNQSQGIVDAVNGIADELIRQLPTKDQMDDGYPYYYYELQGTVSFMFYAKLKSIQ